MRQIRHGFWLLPVLCGVGLALHQDGKPQESSTAPVAADYDEAYEELLDSYNEAEQAFLQPYYDAKEGEEPTLDFDKHPAKAFLPKFVEFETRARGSDAGARALVWVFNNGAQHDKSAAAGAMKQLVETYMESAELEGFASSLQNAHHTHGREVCEVALEDMITGSPHAVVRASATFNLGAMLMGLDEEGKNIYVYLHLRPSIKGAHSGTERLNTIQSFILYGTIIYSIIY